MKCREPGFRLTVHAELFKWGSLPLGAYREGMKSINVKQAVNGQIIGSPRLKGLSFIKPSPRAEIQQTHPKGNKSWIRTCNIWKASAVCLRNTTSETGVSTPNSPSKVLSNNTDHIPNSFCLPRTQRLYFPCSATRVKNQCQGNLNPYFWSTLQISCWAFIHRGSSC